MPRGKVATDGFGARILRLQGDRKLTDIAKAAGLRYGLVWRWTKRDEPPAGMRDRITLLERALGGSLLDDEEGEMVNVNRLGESAVPYNNHDPGRVAQPYDFKKKALKQMGLARHELSALLAAIEEGRKLGQDELEEHLEKADAYCAKAQRHLLGKIRVNDNGEPV